MHPSNFLIGALLVLAMFAGCMDKGESVQLSATNVPPQTTSTGNTSGGGPGPTTTATTGPTGTPTPPEETEEPKPPKKPLANLTVDEANGTIPYSPSFTITDEANGGGNYNWTIDFGEGNSTNGTGLPVAVGYNYTNLGDYTVNVTVENEAGASNASITVTAKDFARERYSGEWSNGRGACVIGPQAEWNFGDANETTHVEFPINNTTWGLPFSVQFDAEGASAWMVDFYDEDSAHVSSQSSGDAPFVNGTVPMDSALIVIWACNMDGDGGSAEYASATPRDWARQAEAAEEEDADE